MMMSPSFYLCFSLSASPCSLLHPLLVLLRWPPLPPHPAGCDVHGEHSVGLHGHLGSTTGFYLSSELRVDETLAERCLYSQLDAPLKTLPCFVLLSVNF